MFFLLLSSMVFLAQAATAELSFLVETNVSGVSVEGKVEAPQVSYQSAQKASAQIRFDVFALRTGMEKRDAHLREKVFAAQRPGDAEVSFTLRGLVCAPECAALGAMRIKGVTKELRVPLTASADHKVLRGEFELRLSDFQLPRPSFMGVKVEDAVKVQFKVQE